MALTMLDKQAEKSDKSAWSPELIAEFEREKNNPNPCVGNALVSETDRVRVWTIRLKPGERIGFHRHVLDYFWTAVTGGRGRQHVHDGTTVEYTYAPGETRHETYGAGPVQGPRSGKPGRQGHGLHDHRVPAERQQADAAARTRATAGSGVSKRGTRECGIRPGSDRGPIHRHGLPATSVAHLTFLSVLAANPS